MYAVHGGERVKFGVIELTAIVTLYGRKRQIKLSIGERTKRRKSGVGVGLLAERDSP